MANILDYLDWRGDLTFSQDGFHAVDHLLLAELAYVDLEGVLSQEKKTLKEVADAYFSLHTEAEVRKRKTFYRLAPLVLEKCAQTRRFYSIEMTQYVNQRETDPVCQMSAVTFLWEKTIYIAYRGTDDSLDGWQEDFLFAFQQETLGQKRALVYLEKVASLFTGSIVLCGHSKGGNFAQFAAMHASKEIQERIVDVISLDGPGFLEPVWQDIDPTLKSKMHRILPESSMVGILLYSPLSARYCASSAVGLSQHDLLTWKVLGKQLEPALQSKTSQWMETTMDHWVRSIDFKERKDLIDTVFGLFDAADVRCLEDVFSHQIALVKALNKIPKTKRGQVQRLLRQLVQSGKSSLFSKKS